MDTHRVASPGEFGAWHRLSRRQVLRQGGAGIAVVAGLGLSRTAGMAAQATPDTVPSTPPADTPFPPAERDALAATLQGAVAAGLVPGAVVGFWVPGRGTWVAAAGVGDAATGAPVTAADAFRIGSVTKTFTATAVLQLVDDGAVGLDDLVARYVPGVPNGDLATVRQVLSMTAGIPNYTADPAFLAAYTADPLMAFGPEDAIAIAAGHQPDFAPGAEFRYSDTNYIVLGLLIERVTGQPAPEVIARRILAPLGLGRTSFPTSPDMPPPYAHGYLLTNQEGAPREITRSNPDVAWTAGAMVSDLDDMRVWANSLASGALLSPKTQRARLAWTVWPGPPDVEVRYGLGIMEIAGFMGHGGNIFGYSTFVAYLAEEDATFVVLTNGGSTSEGNALGLFAALAQPLFPARFAPPEGAPPSTPPPA